MCLRQCEAAFKGRFYQAHVLTLAALQEEGKISYSEKSNQLSNGRQQTRSVTTLVTLDVCRIAESRRKFICLHVYTQPKRSFQQEVLVLAL